MKILYKDHSGWVGLSEMDGYPIIHTEITQWSVSAYKRYLLIFGKILNQLKESGISRVYSFARSEKTKKFNELFGFSYTGKTIATSVGPNTFIMELLC